MTTNRMRLAVITGSVRTGRFGPKVTDWFAERVRVHGLFDLDVIDLAATPLPAALPATAEELQAAHERPAPMAELAGRLREADAFAVVTPEYNHSYPASLKLALDWHYTEWQAKPVGFVSYGGFGGGLRAVEHLRAVFAELHAVTVRNTISFDGHWARFDADGRLLDPDGPEGAAKALLDQLGWWAEALRRARSVTPYQA
ncbi:NADPH-dependent FMN reductase [Nonomuraea pusilla]|uniref:NAD(P)H-dependent FMN reductase n=1 Tax=Nonomuraea pusilla TaxID=46177 RepID=A0A1H7TJA4_9ACTN|nr:NAD(P)H-dependent oxidoreductase [Nonomuraea pusilla]SEL84972.1 NAD(P)H-dependent FMN reductase [Nonomuraea pusilla]